MRIGDIDIEVRGDANAKVTKKIEKGVLIVAKDCEACDAGIETVNFTVSDWKSVFVEQVKSALNDAKERGRLMPFNIGVRSTLNRACPRCGRDSVATLNVTPSEQFVNKFLAQLSSGDATELYYDTIEINAHIKGGHFERGERGDARDLLTPFCESMQPIENVEAKKAFNGIAEALDAYFSGRTTTAPQPVQIESQIQCLHCLKKAKVRYTLTPIIPTDPQQFHRIATRWLSRHVTPAIEQPQQQQQQRTIDPSEASPELERLMQAAKEQ